MKVSNLIFPKYLDDISDITIVKKPRLNNKYWNFEYLYESLFEKIINEEIKIIKGMKKGFIILLNNSSVILSNEFFLHKKYFSVIK